MRSHPCDVVVAVVAVVVVEKVVPSRKSGTVFVGLPDMASVMRAFPHQSDLWKACQHSAKFGPLCALAVAAVAD